MKAISILKRVWRKYHFVLLVSSIILPFGIASWNVFSGAIPFWYDPARDMLSALDNLRKPTLIGPTSGIPGIFYGPYWIWLLSLGLLVSHDPRVVIFIAATLPYFVVFPFVLYQIVKKIGGSTFIPFWLLFIFGFLQYAIFLWNPNPAPLLFLLLVFTLMSRKEQEEIKVTFIKMFVSGAIAGLLVNFHISFGIGVFAGTVLFFLLSSIKTVLGQKQKVKVFGKELLSLMLFFIGVFAAFIPFFLFELRHGFNQITTIIKTLTAPTSVVSVTGLSKYDIVLQFLQPLAALLGIPYWAAVVVGLSIVLFIIYHLVRGMSWSFEQKRLSAYIICIFITVFAIYMGSKNPVWGYHFIGIEILFLLLLAVVSAHFTVVRYLLFIVAGFVMVNHTVMFVRGLSVDPKSISSLASKEYAVDLIRDDANSSRYAVFVYSSALYTYDFDYLFLWKLDKHVAKQASDAAGESVVYLIIPETSQSIRDDFIHYRTSDSLFHTTQSWTIPDKTTIVKRVKKI